MLVAPATSSLVFAVAAAVSFGLAIKDTVTGRYQPLVFTDHQDEDDGDALDRFGEEQLREQALEEFRARHSVLTEAERLQKLDEDIEAARAVPHESFEGLFGSEVASVGVRFESLVLGGPKGAKDVSQLWADHDVFLLDDGATTHTLYIKIDSDERTCDGLSDQLAEAWGKPTGASWMNPAIGQRAMVDTSNGCVLEFEKVVPIDQWLAKSATAAVPMAAIGRPSKQLAAALGPRANVAEDGSISWTAPGLGFGKGTTSLTAYTKAGRVVGLFASVTANDEAQEAVVARITALVGKEPEQGDQVIWKTSPGIWVETGSQLFLSIGEQLGQRN